MFAADNPGARPPAGWEWLANELDERHATQEQIREAQKMLARDR
jgi:hypothetical protein